jgi:hypothetical protein
MMSDRRQLFFGINSMMKLPNQIAARDSHWRSVFIALVLFRAVPFSGFAYAAARELWR